MKNKDIILLLVSIFIIISAWIIFNIYHNSVTSTISKDINRNIIPINPNFDTKTIDALKKREIVSPIYSIPGKTIVEKIDTSSPSSNTTINQTDTKASQESSLKL